MTATDTDAAVFAALALAANASVSTLPSAAIALLRARRAPPAAVAALLWVMTAAGLPVVASLSAPVVREASL